MSAALLAAPDTTRRWPLLVTGALVLLGLHVRVVQWLGGRSLWLDEALLASSLVSRDHVSLATEPLLYRQAAPLLWLQLARLPVDVFGTDERVLRGVSLLSGCLVLLLAWRLAARLLPAVLVPVAVGLVALHPDLVYYSNEVKPYATDTAVVLALLLLALQRRPLLLGLAGAVAVWLAYPAVWVLAGASLLLVLLAPGRQQRARVALALTPWPVSLGLEYVLVLAPLRDQDVLKIYWADTFPRSVPDLPAWFGRRVLALVDTPLELALAPLALALLLYGGLRLARDRPAAAALVLVPVPVALAAAAVSAYPMADRLALWLVPLAAVVLARTLPDRLPGDLRGRLLLAGTAAALLAVAGPAVVRTLPDAVRPRPLEELAPVLTELAGRLQPGDVVLVDIAAKAAFDYYAPTIGVPRDGVVLFVTVEPGTPCEDGRALRAGGFAQARVWLVFSHLLVDTARLGGPADVLSRAARVTLEAERIERPGAYAVLLDPVQGRPVERISPTPDRCLTVVRSRT